VYQIKWHYLYACLLYAMISQVDVKVLPDKIGDEPYLRAAVLKQLKGFNDAEVQDIRLTRRSIDARGSRPFFLLRYDVFINEKPEAHEAYITLFQDVHNAPEIIIVGAGPAGYFAALECLGLGLKPVVIDRGKDVRERRRDLKAIQQYGSVNPDSNYCFGEGGAGTYSDGKLYTRSHKRGKIDKVLHLFVEHGANPDILVDAHPHIGSNKLPQIISAMRESIERCGGEVHFNTRMSKIILKNGRAVGIEAVEKRFEGKAVILATGHSARDVYRILWDEGIAIEAKPFALGLRIEHAQTFIDKVQYHQEKREEGLPPSAYSLVTQVDDKGVFSFCMCPGGLVVPAATAPGEIVVNGMSLSRRDSPFANSGFVTSIDMDDLEKAGYTGVFAALEFQEDVEKRMFNAGDGSQKAPAQRVEDFVNGVLSPELNESSYIPGLYSAPLHQLLPEFVYQRLRQGLIQLNKKVKGFITNKANIIGVESRTSAPIRIPRDEHTLMHPEVEGLFPCGEGAGYAGGIVSAAMDGQKVAQATAAYLKDT
jgi:uncharacterized FAD-dependent dehydrogenase